MSLTAKATGMRLPRLERRLEPARSSGRRRRGQLPPAALERRRCLPGEQVRRRLLREHAWKWRKMAQGRARP